MNAIKCNKAYLGNIELDLLCAKYSNRFRNLGDYQVGDAVVWDTEKHLFKVAAYEDISTIDPERYIPTGVIAIPSSHDVYGTGEAGVMALMHASLTTPDTGSASMQYMYWGDSNTDHPELNNFQAVPKVGIASGEQNNNAIVNNIIVDNIIMNHSQSSYLPIDRAIADSEHTRAIDGTYYYRNDNNWNNCIPSPYLADGSRNPTYYQTKSPSSTANALSDFNGKSNTTVLCSKATAQADWKTATSITDGTSSGQYPAACACWRFHTVGTSQGDWYLPACGELGYCCVRSKRIDETITKLQSHFGINLCKLDTIQCRTSSEYSSSNHCYVDPSNGRVYTFAKGYYGQVRPFTRLK